MNLTRILVKVFCLTVAAALAFGCHSAQSEGAAAYARYETATAANNLPAARQALLEAVAAQDDVAEYWLALGRVHAALRSYGDAYHAFSRAQELDRSNPDLLRALTELALRLGDLDTAQKHALELDVVSPGDRWVKLVEGYAAFERSNYADAFTASNGLLANLPFDSLAVGLKARALLGLAREEEAVQLLEAQMRSQPSDTGSLLLLTRVHERRNDWENVAAAANGLAKLRPQDTAVKLLVIEAQFRAGDAAAARQASLQILDSAPPPPIVTQVLDLWARFWTAPQRIDDARRLGAKASTQSEKVVYASFLVQAGSSPDALRMMVQAAQLPITAGNADANAVFADALAGTGQLQAAKERFDAVLRFDDGNPMALKGRAELLLRRGMAEQAIPDAQKLVSVRPASSTDRLLLARCYTAMRSTRDAQRTLWSAFQEIPADERIFHALAASQGGNSEALQRLGAEFNRQRDAKLNRGLL